jgi:hypothetical protein
MSENETGYWAIIDLFGHTRIAGRVTEVERYGSVMGRIDIPEGEGFRTEFFGGGSVYRERPCSEEAARAAAIELQPAPIKTWNVPQLPSHDYDDDDSCDVPDLFDGTPF